MDSFFGRRQRRTGRLALAVGLGALLASSAFGWAKPPVEGDEDAAETFGIQAPSHPKDIAKPVRPTPSEDLGIDLANVPAKRLGAVDRDKLLLEDSLAERQGLRKVLRYGIGRDVQVAAADGVWQDVADGSRLWAAEVASTDALGLRLHFKDVRLPEGAVLAVYAPEGAALGTARNGYSRFDPERHVELYSAASARADFWTGSFAGDRVRIEYLAPAGSASAGLPFALDNLQHFYLDPVDKVARSLVREKAAGPCHNDVTCYPEWANVAAAVSGIGFIVDGGSGFCTGQLLNTTKEDFTPYWLTANHCLDRQSQAASAEFYWFYQTSTCNGTPPSINSVPRSEGASLVATSPVSDFTLLMIDGALPDGVFFAGWTNKTVAQGTEAVAIHHPSADYKRISFGYKDEGSACEDRNLLRISWTDAPTEPGSSGSGIFRADTQQLFGQLFFGPSSCGNESFDCYGAFVSTYPKVKKFLTKPASDDSSEQNDSCSRARVVKTGTLSNRVVKANDTDWYKINVPAGRTVRVRLSFNNGNGDVDLKSFASCSGGEPLSTSATTEDGEEVALSNVGSRSAFAYWQVYLGSDTRNNYNMTVSFE
ncbi:MAG: trypsin-like peptidase domain-containing protein [Thermoanaerobaculia bacterium]